MPAETVNFTIRVSPEVNAQLEARASANRRKRSVEVVYMLEQALDAIPYQDIAQINVVAGRSAS